MNDGRAGPGAPALERAEVAGTQGPEPSTPIYTEAPSRSHRLFRRLRRLFARNWSDAVFLLLAGLLYYWVVRDAFTTRMVTLSPGADYWEHTGTLDALIQDPWHPRNPHLESPASSPRFGPLFVLSALIARAFDLDALGGMGVATAVNTLLLLIGIFCFFRAYFRDVRASLYGLIVMFGSWWSAWHFSNVYQLKIFFSVAAYPSTGALGLSLIGFSLALAVLRRKISGGVGFCLLTLLWTATLITHPLTALLGFAGNVLLALTSPSVPFRLRLMVAATPVVGIPLAELWPYFSTFRVLDGGAEGAEELGEAISAALEDEAATSKHMFYKRRGLVNTLGYALGGIPICLYLLLRFRHLFIPLGACAMAFPFIVNVYVPLPLGHRFILLTVFFLQVALVWLLLKFTRGSPEAVSLFTRGARGWVCAVVLAFLLYEAASPNVHGAMARYAGTERRLGGRESRNLAYARRAAEIAGRDAVILADARTAWPLPTFGPRIVSLFHPNPLVRDEPRRSARVRRFFSPRSSRAERLAIIREYGVTHVLVNRRVERFVADFLRERATRQRLPAGYVLYSLDQDATEEGTEEATEE